MSMEIRFNQSTSLEQKLVELQKIQNELAAQQRENIRQIQDTKNKIRQEEIRKAEELHLQKLEAEKRRLEAQYEDTVRRIGELCVNSWDDTHGYQKEDIIEMFHSFRKGDKGFFNANGLGLGKTLESIITLLLLFGENPDAKCLWLTKSSIMETGGTKREINRWAPGIPVVEISGSQPKKKREFQFELLKDMSNLVVITNYETIRTTEVPPFEYIVMDEVHKLKGGANPSGPTDVWKAIRNYLWGEDFKAKFDYIMMLSGTPMVNRVAELWAYLHIFAPDRFMSLKTFENAFNAYQEMGGRVNTSKILDLCLKDRMVCRTSEEVGLELPELTDVYNYIQYTPKQQEVYDQMKSQFFIWLDRQEGKALTATAIIAQLVRLRQISVWPVFTQQIKDDYGDVIDTVNVDVRESGKIDECMDIIEQANDQVVVFCNFNEPFVEIKRRCEELNLSCRFITGATKKDMHTVETDFQQGRLDVLCINSSMGEGLNLQKNPEQWPGGSRVGIHLDSWWNPARELQCNGRIYRQGATHAVSIYRIHCPTSIDNYVKMVSDEKGEIFDGIMGGSQIRPSYEWKTELKDIL